MYYIKTILCALACLMVLQLSGQSEFEGLGESSFAVNKQVSSDYKFNFSLRSRYYFYQDKGFNFNNRQIDLVHFSTLNLDYNHSLSFGVQYRFRESIDGESDELRLTQQFNYTKKDGALRYGHRLRFEQRLLDQLTIFRGRYRFALDLPLNGEKLDVGEGYLVSAMEGLISVGKQIKPELDHRTTVQIGWLISETLKLQFGVEYRFEAFNIATEEKLFILTSAILKL